MLGCFLLGSAPEPVPGALPAVLPELALPEPMAPVLEPALPDAEPDALPLMLPPAPDWLSGLVPPGTTTVLELLERSGLGEAPGATVVLEPALEPGAAGTTVVLELLLEVSGALVAPGAVLEPLLEEALGRVVSEDLDTVRLSRSHPVAASAMATAAATSVRWVSFCIVTVSCGVVGSYTWG